MTDYLGGWLTFHTERHLVHVCYMNYSN